ncbi:YncE family protein [Streptosporangium saharense]|uniref:YncE family protein n=1 Tax=Streptosporangium saharense TaxID=1706840 RepID=UPI00369AEC41
MPFSGGAQLAVLSQSGHTLNFFDLDSGRRTDVVDVLPEGHELCFDPARRVVYASHTYRSGHYLAHEEKGTEISVVDVDTHRILDVIDLAPEHAPHALQLDPATGLLYVSVEGGPQGPGGLLALDPRTREVRARYSAEAPIPHWAVLTPDGRRAYTANKQSPYVSVIDLADGGPVRRVPVAGSEDLALSPDGTRLFVATPTISVPADPRAAYAVRVVDTASDEVVHGIPLDEVPSPVHVTDDGTLLVGQWRFTGAPAGPPFRSGLLSVFDAVTYEPRAELEVGLGPTNIVSTPDSTTAFVANLQSGTVSVVDLTTFRVVTTLEVDRGERLPAGRGVPNQGAHGLAYIPAAG